MEHPQTTETKEQVVTLKPSNLVVLCIVVLCAVALAYVGGVMSGRKSAENEYYQSALKAEEPKEKEQEEPSESPGILSARELEFSRVLRNSNMLTEPKTQFKPVPQPELPKKETDAPAIILPKPSGLTDYVYQVAAVKGDDAADALRQRLEGRGLRTYMKRQGNLLLIQIKMRGNAAQTKELLKILESLHLGHPILISQKPAKD
ncbi:MAG: hypothetical protein IJS54_01005 [Desulfovibrio sp.]|nr:hypothetical protein [Desulfovibrio sp.]